MSSIKVGDLVTPSCMARKQLWWSSVCYLSNAELLVTKIERSHIDGQPLISFHAPKFGTRRWKGYHLKKVVFTLENE